ncbi:MAG: hypothetical protein HY718_12850, partial [Planctomycetes bacterium]|nr:hypothetical protein [Planctomycetota bacterium]
VLVLLPAAFFGVVILRGQIRPGLWPHGWLCAILGFLVLPSLLRTYRRTTRPVARSIRLVLVVLRLAAAGAALAILARPVMQWTTERRERAVVGILLDTSQSMSIRDVTDPPSAAGDGAGEPMSRSQAVRAALDACRDPLRRLSDQLSVETMAFDARLRRTSEPDLSSAGTLTALGRCVDAAREALIQTGSRIAGLIVISDGRDTAGGDTLQAGDNLALAGIPLFTVGVGNEVPAGETRSVQARRLDMPDRVGILNQLDIGAEFLAAGLVGTPIEVRLEYDGQPAGQQEVVPTQVRELVRADLSHVPKAGGLHQVTVIATVPGLEGRQGQAELSRYVRVTEDKVQVLYIDRSRYERAAVARSLEHAKELNVTKIDLNAPATDARAQGPQPAGSPLPTRPDEWKPYHVIILGDVDRSHLPDAPMRAMANLVTTAGRGMAILGGLRTLGSGAYRGTPLEGLFPVDLGVTGQIEGPVPFELTPAGRTHPCCQLADPNLAAWKQLPPFAGASRLTSVAPAAEVLIRTAGDEPLLVLQEKAGGRTAVLAFDSTWQWPFSSEAGLDMHRRFWRQLVLWLANRRPEVWVLADRPSYDLLRLRTGDEQVVLHAGVNDPTAGGPVSQISVSGDIIGPDGVRRPLTFKALPDGFEATATVDQQGEYRVAVEGKAGQQSAGRAETAFVVESADRELADPLADLETLKRMAARTATIGGGYIPLEQLGELLERVRAAGIQSRTTLVQRHYLVDDHPWFWLGVFVGLLTLEWIIRRRTGLV